MPAAGGGRWILEAGRRAPKHGQHGNPSPNGPASCKAAGPSIREGERVKQLWAAPVRCAHGPTRARLIIIVSRALVSRTALTTKWCADVNQPATPPSDSVHPIRTTRTNGSISRVFTFSWLSRAVSGQPRQRCHPASSQAINIKNSRCKKEESVAHRAQYNPLASCGLRARARALVPPAWPSRVHVVRGTPGRDADMDADRSPNRPPTARPAGHDAGRGRAEGVSSTSIDQSAWKSQRLLRLDV